MQDRPAAAFVTQTDGHGSIDAQLKDTKLPLDRRAELS
jgi:hypothetical protein